MVLVTVPRAQLTAGQHVHYGTPAILCPHYGTSDCSQGSTHSWPACTLWYSRHPLSTLWY